MILIDCSIARQALPVNDWGAVDRLQCYFTACSPSDRDHAMASDPLESRRQDFERFCSANYAQMYAVALRRLGDPHSALDAVQETFKNLWQDANFSPNRWGARSYAYQQLEWVVLAMLRPERNYKPRSNGTVGDGRWTSADSSTDALTANCAGAAQ